MAKAARSLSLFVVVIAVVAGFQFTGDAKRDFITNLGSFEYPVVKVDDPSIGPDVGVPNQVSAGENIISGWDIESIYFHYDPRNNELNIGIDCFVICGDADGRLGPDVSSPQLLSIGGQDTPDLSGSESFALQFGFGADRKLQYIIGTPGGNPTLGAPLPCNEFGMKDCFGLYTIENLAAVAPAFRFLKLVSTPGLVTYNRNPLPTGGAGDLEYTILGVKELRVHAGFPFVKSAFESWSMFINCFAGSFVDSGIGEEYVPDQFSTALVTFPCLLIDSCDVCLGDGSSCPDCKGIPQGPNTYDRCDVCGGKGDSCLDCKGIPQGPNKYDRCDVCGGKGDSCLDCMNMVAGTATYDRCDVCGGDSSTCLDCRGVPNGGATYDACDVCGGNGASCRPPVLMVTYFGDIVEQPEMLKEQKYKGFNDFPMPKRFNPW